MDDSIDFQPYLSSICHDYAEWWKLYTLTDIEGKSADSSDQNKRIALFDFGLMMQSVNKSVNKREPEASQQERAEKPEQQPVLDGLRRSLTEAKHVLLIGRPGSGKSTALARLLLEEAQQSQADFGEKKIPVLVELGSYKTSVLALIQDFFTRHDLVLEIHQVETLLAKNCLLLLVDGLNELPSKAARQDIVNLRNHRRAPMIFTTRDLSLGGDFGIENQWEMLPLTEPQMKKFIGAHLSPEQVDAMWRQLQGRTRKFAETPLLLWMLCELFTAGEVIPRNLGEVFRIFTRTYENSSIRKHEVAALKGDVQPLSDRRLWFPALKHLAYLMMQGETPVDSRTFISREEAEEELRALFSEETSPPEVARNCLDDLLKYHLLQNRTADEIEFHHQLFQEYYAAEWLLQQLPDLSDEQLKHYFLNYLKWTEAIVLLLGLLENKASAVQTVKLALEVDLILGAKLVGSVKSNFQEQTIYLVEKLILLPVIKVTLLGEIGSEITIKDIYRALSYRKNLDFFKSAIKALEKIDLNIAVAALVEALNTSFWRWDNRRGIIYSHEEIRIYAINTLLKIDTDAAFSALVELLSIGEANPFIREQAALALGKISPEFAVSFLIESLNAKEPNACYEIIDALGQIGSDTATEALVEILSDPNSDIRIIVADALGRIGSDAATRALIEALSDPISSVRLAIVEALAMIGSEIAVGTLVEALNDSDQDVYESATEALVELGYNPIIENLLQALEDTYLYNRIRAAKILGRVGIDSAIRVLIQSLNDTNASVRWEAAFVLGEISSETAVIPLIKALNDPILKVRKYAVWALGEIGSDSAVQELIHRLHDQNSTIRMYAAEALGKICNKDAVPALLKILDDSSKRVCGYAANALGKIGSESSVESLVQKLTDAEDFVRQSAAEALGSIGSPKPLSYLKEMWLSKGRGYMQQAIQDIQNNCKFYNYEIAKSDPPLPINSEKLSANGSPTYIFQAPVGNVADIVHGNQINYQDSPLNSKQLPTNYLDSTTQAKDVLEIIFNTGRSLERSSREVRSLPEESLREFFIPAIDVRCPESASAETRNKDGKTDILVRVAGRNFLIVECKFWGGEEKLKATLDQLLDRYTTVRDTQIAMLIFSRNKDFTNVKRSIPQAMEKHSSFGREISIDLEKAWYEYVVFHPEDRACELTLTVLAFHLSP